MLKLMKLHEYLRALKNCPDEIITKGGRMRHRLTREFGIYNNWPILLAGNFEAFVEHLKSTKYTQKVDGSEHFLYNPGTVRLLVFDHVGDALTTGHGANLTEKIKKHFERQKREFTMSIGLYILERRIAGVNQEKVFVEVIKDISRYVLRNNLKLCFPNSIGWDNLEDLSRIVYYPE